ncbi:unnamed protein product [Angiostrongylus costaricensis]|uniref:guanylate kinase n=1 Tax=Angiostrongylus costaricensis TaxID=334426 RepID=A0A0R3PME8_ANGCS|nr:unnamed protein product [Angiostrongylus costaricensis]
MPHRPIVLSGPSGGGKSTILARAMKDYPNKFAFSVSHTTRKPREGEEHGVHYWFTDHIEFERMIAEGEFLEHATFGGNIYGTSKKAVDDVGQTGKICVLDIELQGVRNIKKTNLNARYILIRAPSLEILESRLRARGTEGEEDIQRRLKHAKEDLETVERDPELFDHVIINSDFERAYKEFIAAIQEDLMSDPEYYRDEVPKTFFVISLSINPENFYKPVFMVVSELRPKIHPMLSQVFKDSAKKIMFLKSSFSTEVVHSAFAFGVDLANFRMATSFSRLPPLPSLRDFIHMYRLRAKKILSQNYLMDMNLTRKHLAEASEGRLHVHCGDILKTSIGDLWSDGGHQRISEWSDEPPNMNIVDAWRFGRIPLTLTFQMEVAKRICSPIDDDARSRISIMAQYLTEPKILFRIPGACFVPQPDIDVGVVRFMPRIQPLISAPFEVVEKLCRQVFHYRQKHMIKGLKTLYPKEVSS